MSKGLYIALSWFLILGAGPALAGWVIKGPQVTIEVRQNMVRAGGPYRKMIYDLNQNQITFIHIALAKYWRGSPREFKRTMQDLTKKELLRSMKRLPQQLKKAYLRKLEKRFPSIPDQNQYKVFVIHKNENMELAGYKAYKTEIWINKKLREEFWQAHIPELLKEWDQKKFLFMSLEMSITGYKAWQRYPQVVQARTKGLALKSIIHTQNGKKMGSRVFSIAREDLPESLFRPPQGFHKATLDQLNP